jgi:FecR protein
MNIACKAVVATSAGLLAGGWFVAASTAEKDARVTRIIRDVKILPPDSAAQPAVLDQTVAENMGVRTGNRSRSELTFADLTITRLGADTIFHFNRAGRSADMASGSMLLRVPKNSGGATINGSAVTVAIAGTTVIFEGNRAGHTKLIVLEGGARARLNKYPKHSQYVRAGQMLDVKAGATRLPRPVNIDLRRIMKTNPLITDFPPLPSQNLIFAAIRDQQSGRGAEPVYPSRPVSGPPPRSIFGGSVSFGGGGRVHGRTHRRPSGPGGAVIKPQKPHKRHAQTTASSSGRTKAIRHRKPSPTATPRNRTF